MCVKFFEWVDMIGKDPTGVNMSVARLPLGEMVVHYGPEEWHKEERHREGGDPTPQKFLCLTPFSYSVHS